MPPAWTDRSYSYSPEKPHAVTALSTGEEYTYDENGNMVCRVENRQTYLQFYNAENRMLGAWAVAGTCDTPGLASATWNFVYDGDGNRVKQVYYSGGRTLLRK